MEEKKKVLIVDDEKSALNLLERFLSQQGFEVLRALSGAEALQKAREARPDLILLDVKMPEMDGFETCRILRSDRANDAIPIAMLTFKDEASDIVRALQAGADDYIFKSVRKDELFKKIDVLLCLARSGTLPSLNYLRKTRQKAEKPEAGES